MFDIAVLYDKEEKPLIENILKELRLCGVRTSVNNITDVNRINELINQTLESSSSAILFISSSIANKIIEKQIQISKNSRILPFSYKNNDKTLSVLKKYVEGLCTTKNRASQSIALELMTEIGNPDRKIIFSVSYKFEDIWDSPLTIYQIADSLRKNKEIILDVTWSALPTRSDPAPALIKTLRRIIEYMGGSKYRILDCGAGKLRHTVLLLEGGHSVTAVEYEQLFINPSASIQGFIDQANKFGKRFGQITYPAQLISTNKKFDLVTLINVVSIIPDPLERLFVLYQCNKKLENNKYLLWFAQYGDADQREFANLSLTDGGCLSGKSRSTFYTEFDSTAVDFMMGINGFKRVNISLDSGKNQAWLYQKTGKPLIDIQQLTAEIRNIIERKVIVGKTNNETAIADVLYEDKHPKMGQILKKSLNNIAPGRSMPYYYENVMKHIIAYIFYKDCISTEVQSQYETQRGRQRVDIKTRWKTNSEIEKILSSYNLKSSYVPIECKNYRIPIGNSEYAQLVLRCDRNHRHFGIIFCRNISEEQDIIASLNGIYNQHGYVIVVLDDNDVQVLLDLVDENSSNPLPWTKENCDENLISRFLNKRVEEVIHNKDIESSQEIFASL